MAGRLKPVSVLKIINITNKSILEACGPKIILFLT
jgi:hypothetical protein